MSISLAKQPHKPDYFIGGSDARIIMGKDEKALLRLCRQKWGEAVALDLSGVLIVQLGLVTEDLNRRWYELNSGHRRKGHSGGTDPLRPCRLKVDLFRNGKAVINLHAEISDGALNVGGDKWRSPPTRWSRLESNQSACTSRLSAAMSLRQ